MYQRQEWQPHTRCHIKTKQNKTIEEKTREESPSTKGRKRLETECDIRVRVCVCAGRPSSRISRPHIALLSYDDEGGNKQTKTDSAFLCAYMVEKQGKKELCCKMRKGCYRRPSSPGTQQRGSAPQLCEASASQLGGIKSQREGEAQTEEKKKRHSYNRAMKSQAESGEKKKVIYIYNTDFKCDEKAARVYVHSRSS